MSNYLSNNIFLITLDALSARYMEIYDNEHFSEFFEEKAKTPFLKEFLKDSVKFNKCYTNSNMTIVSTRQFQEGRYVSYPMSQKEKGDIPLTTNALSIKLKEAGYNTCAYLGDGDWIFRAMEAVYNEYKIISDGIEFIVDKSKNWLSNNKENKTFLWLHVSDTHMCAAPKHLDKDIGGYGSWDKFKNFDKTKFLCRFKEKPNSDLNIMLAYAKSISYCDFILNDFFNFIKKLGIYEKSTIIISADHGSAYGDISKNYGHHDTPHENVFNIPLIVKFANNAFGGSESSIFTQTIDVPKTILEIAEADIPKTYEGHSLIDICKGKEEKKFVIMECGRIGHVWGIKTDDWFNRLRAKNPLLYEEELKQANKTINK